LLREKKIVIKKNEKKNILKLMKFTILFLIYFCSFLCPVFPFYLFLLNQILFSFYFSPTIFTLFYFNLFFCLSYNYQIEHKLIYHVYLRCDLFLTKNRITRATNCHNNWKIDHDVKWRIFGIWLHVCDYKIIFINLFVFYKIFLIFRYINYFFVIYSEYFLNANKK